MHLVLEPNVGANQLKFGSNRKDIRAILPTAPLTKRQEPENDFYEKEGLILGYDNDDKLEYIEIVRPSTAAYKGIVFFSLNLDDCLFEMKRLGLTALFDDGGYNFETVGIAFYCPQGILESVSLYKEGYYDDL